MSLLYKGKKLTHIENLTDFIDEKGCVKCDVFNKAGAILTIKGQVPRAKIFHQYIYIYEDVYKEYEDFKKSAPQEKTAAAPPQEDKDFINKKEELKKDVGEDVIKTYDFASQTLNQLLDGKELDSKRVKASEDLIDQTLKTDMIKLHACLTKLRTIDSYTLNHCLSVAVLMIKSLEEFKKLQDTDNFWRVFKGMHDKVNFTPNGIKKYGVGGLLHDLGKVMIPGEVLNKPGPLTPEEFEIIKKHPVLGVKALEKINMDDPQLLSIVGNHHPAYLTFPDEGQSSLAMICSIVDIYDACRSPRVYKKAYSFDQVVEILTSGKNKYHWDHFIFDVIVQQVLPEFEANQ